MTKEVYITLKGLHSTVDAEDNKIEVIIPGEYYFRNDKHFVCYEEVVEGAPELSKSVIKIGDGFVELIKRGPGANHMFFEKGKKNYTYYKTVMGDLYMGIDTKNISITQSEELIRAVIQYELEFNEQKMSDCEVCIEIKSSIENDIC